MAAEEMVDDLRHAYERWTQGDPGPATALFADDIRWTVPGDHALSGTYTGAQEIQEMWMKLPEHLRGLEVHDFFTNGDRIVVTTTVALDVGSATQVDLIRLSGGKIVEFEGVQDTALWERAFGSE
jgi:ketosteroid isomerase-like protein